MINCKKYCILTLIVFVFISSCDNKRFQNYGNQSAATVLVGDKDFLAEYPPISTKGKVNVVVEIPAGTIAKWELDKTNGVIRWEKKEGRFREVQYLGYPGNYGFIPGTLLPKEKGGDGDPLDVIILSPYINRGTIVECDIIGVLEMFDNGEQDDKLIAVSNNSPFSMINSISELNYEYPGIATIISTWFENYKGIGAVDIIGFNDQIKGEKILFEAINEYNKR